MYAPAPAPNDPKALSAYVRGEFERIAAELRQPTIVLKVLHVAPDKPRDGMVILADGADFDPGSGAGFYGYLGGAWTFLG